MVKGRQVSKRVTRPSMYTVPSNEVSTWYTGHVQMGVFVREEPPWVTLIKAIFAQDQRQTLDSFLPCFAKGAGCKTTAYSSLVGDNSSILFNLTIILYT